MIKPATLCLALLMLAACMTDPNLAVDGMKGSGSVNRSPDGQTTFRYVIAGNAYAGVLKSEAEVEVQHKWLIENFIGTGNYCPDGFTLTSNERDAATGAYVYEGVCK